MNSINILINLRKKLLSNIFYLISIRSGFTLIELLVTISIIAVLTSLLAANFIGARERGRDGQRKSNLYQIQSALELYRSDAGGYPPNNSMLSSCGNSLTRNSTVYMQKIPCDPSSSNQAFIYSALPPTCNNTDTMCATYTLVACLENEQDAERDATKNAGCTNTDTSFTLLSP